MSEQRGPVENRVGDGLSVRASGSVALLLLVGMVGGAAALLGELLESTEVGLAGLTVVVTCSVAAGAFAVVDSRRRGVTVRRSLWDGVRTIFRWVAFLF